LVRICDSIGIDHGFAFLDLAQQIIGQPLCDQLILAMIEFTIQRVGPIVELLSEALISFARLLTAFACRLFPSLHVSQAFFQGGSQLGHLRVLDGCLGKTVIDIPDQVEVKKSLIQFSCVGQR
jgi:hypothetical protein